MSKAEMQDLLVWFRENGGYLDPSVGFKEFSPAEGGRGAVALADISQGSTLFTIPRTLVLSTRTSVLRSEFSNDEWTSLGLDQGWAGLILCMMWESAQGTSSNWAPYMHILPTTFTIPMFWPPEDLEELIGTATYDKIGKAAAETVYSEIIVPCLQKHPDIFAPGDIDVHYSVHQFHIMGSSILSRSFEIEQSDEEDLTESTTNPVPDDASIVAKEDQSDQEEDHTEIAMVPIADMLNARFGCENAKLFYEKETLKMISTKQIQAGEQIWNTYGDLPNAELLRRYGHIDWMPLPEGGEGNPGDVVEINGDMFVTAVGRLRRQEEAMESIRDRIGWWLDQGGDDVFVVEQEDILPQLMLSFVNLLVLNELEWQKTRLRGKPPKPKATDDVLTIIEIAILLRLERYPTTIEDDLHLLESQSLTLNGRNAIGIRQGEKRLLHSCLREVTKTRSEKRKASDLEASGKRQGI